MSALGHKRTWRCEGSCPLYKADMCSAQADVRFVPKADMRSDIGSAAYTQVAQHSPHLQECDPGAPQRACNNNQLHQPVALQAANCCVEAVKVIGPVPGKAPRNRFSPRKSAIASDMARWAGSSGNTT